MSVFCFFKLEIWRRTKGSKIASLKLVNQCFSVNTHSITAVKVPLTLTFTALELLFFGDDCHHHQISDSSWVSRAPHGLGPESAGDLSLAQRNIRTNDCRNTDPYQIPCLRSDHSICRTSAMRNLVVTFRMRIFISVWEEICSFAALTWADELSRPCQQPVKESALVSVLTYISLLLLTFRAFCSYAYSCYCSLCESAFE